jgi:hypothetical protein
MTPGLLLTSFALGLRHGIDWDHIAAIVDLSSGSDDRGRGFRLSLYYAIGHALVVFALGSMLIVAGASIPESLDEWMGPVVGATLIGLGITVLRDLQRNRGAVRLRSRWTLVLEGTFAGLRRVRRYRDRRRIVIEHIHGHEHDGEIAHDTAPAHDHAHQHAIVRALQPAISGSAVHHGRRHRHRHVHQLDLPVDQAVAGRGVATGIGMLHGIGIESPTQVAIFIASTSVVGTTGGLTLLGAWVGGLVIANTTLALVAGVGLLRPDANTRTVRAVAIVVAAMSIALGVHYLLA